MPEVSSCAIALTRPPCLSQVDPEETTKKYGLEAGLWQVFTNKDPNTGKTKGQQAKDLLKRYGSAYLITSISFAIVSFAACYALVSAGSAPTPCAERCGA